MVADLTAKGTELPSGLTATAFVILNCAVPSWADVPTEMKVLRRSPFERMLWFRPTMRHRNVRVAGEAV